MREGFHSKHDPASNRLTPAQERALIAFARLVDRDERSPTARELAAELDMSAASAHELVEQLVRKGFLARDPLKARGLKLVRLPTPEPRGLVALPILGKVLAGNPVCSPEHAEGEVLVDAALVRGRACFALRVKGDSMQTSGIVDGSIVLVRQQQVADSGDVVVALLNGEATVKRLYFDEAMIELRPENPRFKTIRVGPDDELRVVGKVIGVRTTD
jgi:repressor LexA